MGFFDEKKKQDDKQQKPAPKDNKSFFSKATDAVFGNTKKLAGTVRAGAGGVYGLGKIAGASVFGDDEDYKKAIAGADQTLTKDLADGKSFFKDRNEAQNASGKDLTRIAISKGVGTATEVVPFARGAQIASNTGKVGINLAKAGAEGAGYGAANSVAAQIDDGQDGIDLGSALKDTLIGTASGAAGFGIGKGVDKGLRNIKPVHADNTPMDRAKSALTGDVPKQLGGSTHHTEDAAPFDYSSKTFYHGTGTPGLSADSLDSAATRPDGLFGAGVYLTDNADIAKGYAKARGGGNNQHLYKAKINPKNVFDLEKPITPEARSAFEKMASSIEGKDWLGNYGDGDLSREIKSMVDNGATGEEVHEALTKAMQDASSEGRGFDMASIAEEFAGDMKYAGYDALTHTGGLRTGKPAHKVVIALDPQDASGSGLQNPITEFKTTQKTLANTSLVNVDTNLTIPEQAKASVAQSMSDIKPVVKPLDRAKQSLTGIKPVATTTEAVTPVGKGAQSIAQKLDEQLGTFGNDFSAPDEIIKALSKGDAVTRQARKNDWLDRYEDTLSVLGRHFGKTGTDLGYKLAEGAKRVSDIQETVRPGIDSAKKLLDGMSKSKSGRAEIQERIYSALEDRANADQYLTSPKEKELYDHTVQVFDFFKQQRVAAGKNVIENDYSPRAAVSSALDAPERLLDSARTAFGTDVKSRFSKERVKHIDDAEINRNIIDLLPMYASSQSKEFGYEGAMKFATESLKDINPAYATDRKAFKQGQEYLQELMSQVLDPPTVSKAVQRQNKLIGQTYKSNLKWSPRYALQNMTQRFATKSVVTKEAEKLAKSMDKTEVDAMRKGLFAGDSTILDEINNSADSLGNTPKTSRLSRLEPGSFVEKGNVHGAFDRGVAQQIVESAPYKNAIKQGFKPNEAAKLALQDEGVRDLAIRRGNMVMNDTQFGANFITKPEFFRESKSHFGLSDKWYKQYQRFPHGMIQNMTTILHAKDARALDILKRGDPTQTKLVDFKYSAEALHNGVDDLIKGIKNGEVHDVSLEVAEGYQKTLQKAIKELDNGMKKVSVVRSGKTAKSIAKMWGAASAIQWLFDGGFAMTEPENQEKALKRAAQFGAPISIPTRDQNPLAGAAIPASPFRPALDPKRLLNFVPVVGTVANRGREVNRFVSALTGDN